ncbi:MAG: diguanylate cyclase [Gammaproteobacteria bacterium]|nr:diguanylate cyclase [Gammaproteobacteria bacterium]
MKILALTLLLIGSGGLWASEPVSSLLQTADEIRLSEPQKFSAILRDIAQQIDSLSSEQRYFFEYLMAYESALKGDSERAINTYKHVFKNASDQDLIYRASYSILNVLVINRRWRETPQYLQYINDNYTSISSEEIKATGLVAVALFYNHLGNFDKARDYGLKAIADIKADNVLCTGYQQLAHSELKLNLLASSAAILSDGMSACERSSKQLIAYMINLYQATALFKEEQYDAATALLQRHLSRVDASNYVPIQSEYYALLAQLSFATGNVSGAIAYAQKVINSNNQSHNTEALVKALKIMADATAIQGNLTDSIVWLKRYAETDKAFYDQLTAENLAFQLATHEVIEKENQIKLLNKENEALNLERDLSLQEAQNKTLMIILLILIIGFTSFWAYRTKKTHVKLRKLAEFDSLTGIANRRHFTKEGENTLKINRSRGQAVSFILFDLDKFKAINDRYGHPVGDWVLQHVPIPVKKIIRKIDIFGRMGGEEFAILLPGCELDKAREIAESIRLGLMEINCEETGHNFNISASFGITVSRVSGYEFEDLMKHSDDALYEAKREGRNRIHVYSMPPTESAVISKQANTASDQTTEA